MPIYMAELLSAQRGEDVIRATAPRKETGSSVGFFPASLCVKNKEPLQLHVATGDRSMSMPSPGPADDRGGALLPRYLSGSCNNAAF